MTYTTYTTEALVCGTYDRYTSDRSYLLFTKDAGMLYADAKSVRLEKSRQRYAMQDFSLVKVSLVKGRSGWRIGSVEALENYYRSAADRAARGSIVTAHRTLRRFIRGEEPHPELFIYVRDALSTLSQSVKERKQLEQIMQVQVLSQLGYVDKKQLPDHFSDRSLKDMKADAISEKALAKILSDAVSASHL